MKPIILIILLFLSSLNPPLWAQEKQVVIPYTLADRNRAIGTDAKIAVLDAKISALDVRFESIDKQFMYQQNQIDDIKTLFYWGFGILITIGHPCIAYMVIHIQSRCDCEGQRYLMLKAMRNKKPVPEQVTTFKSRAQ